MVYFGNLVRRFAFGFAIFTSAFLLFQVQLLLGKFLLPWFGGTSGIWATCLLFFQVLLLAGYYYAHRISSAFRPAGQGQIHLAFLALAGLWILLAWFLWGSPLLPGPSWKPQPGAAPIVGIIKLLVVSVGVPFLLSFPHRTAVAKLVRASRRRRSRENAILPLRAIECRLAAGFVELSDISRNPQFRLKTQSWLWGVGFGLFLLSCMVCAWLARSSRAQDFQPLADAPVEVSVVAPSPRWLWFALPMLGVGYAPGYHQFFDTRCRANSTALGHTPLHLLAEFYSHVSRDLVSPLVVPSTFRRHRFACRPGIISRRRHATYIADRSLSGVSFCRLHGLPWRSRSAETQRTLSHFILSSFVRRWRSWRHLCCHYRAFDFPDILGVSAGSVGYRPATPGHSFSRSHIMAT